MPEQEGRFGVIGIGSKAVKVVLRAVFQPCENESLEKVLRNFIKSPRFGVYMSPETRELMLSNIAAIRGETEEIEKRIKEMGNKQSP